MKPSSDEIWGRGVGGKYVNGTLQRRGFSMKGQYKCSSWVFESRGKPVDEECRFLVLPMLLPLGGMSQSQHQGRIQKQRQHLLNNCSCLFFFTQVRYISVPRSHTAVFNGGCKRKLPIFLKGVLNQVQKRKSQLLAVLTCLGNLNPVWLCLLEDGI